MSAFQLLQHILNDLTLNNVQVKLELTDTVFQKEGGECVGFFDSDTNTLCVAVNYDDWFMTLVHEYCHFKQFQENLWSSRADLDLFSKREKWALGNAEMTEMELLFATRLIQECELDCEKRVIQMALQYLLPINMGEYIRYANSYVLSYELERLKGKTLGSTNHSGKAAHLCPTEFITDLSFLPPGYAEAFNDESTSETNQGPSPSA
jgi:hypothetical protein